MRVLVACEESQVVCKAFRSKGHLAFSCDIKPCSGGHPEWHIQTDVIQFLKDIEPFFFDLIIAHPPCTYLSVAGAANFYKNGLPVEERFQLQRQARDFFMFFYNYDGCNRICIENPRPMKSAMLPPYDDIIQPYDFGDPWSKQTFLWLKGLPPLFHFFSESNRRSAFPSWCEFVRSSAKRSVTFSGIAEAMASQWSF